MKNKKLLYILLTMITFFSYNLTVNAAQELTCVYEAGDYDIKTILIQYESGERIFYTNSDKNATLDTTGWAKQTDWTIILDSNTDKDSSGNLKSCPKHVQHYQENNENEKKFTNTLNFAIDEWTIIYNPKLSEGGEYKKIIAPKTTVGIIDDTQNNNEGLWMNDLIEPYKGMCIYEKNYTNIDGSIYVHKIQILYSENNIYITEEDPLKHLIKYGETEKKNYSGISSASILVNQSEVLGRAMKYTTIVSFSVEAGFDENHLKNTYFGNCPVMINVFRKVSALTPTTTGHGEVPDYEQTISTQIQMEQNKKNDDYHHNYYLKSVKGVNPITGETLTLEGIHTPVIDFKPNIETCEQLLGEDVIKYINIVWNIIKFGIPIILIGLGTLDFVQAIFSGKEDGMKKAQSKFIKRIIISVVIFLVPTLLKLLLDIADGVWGDFGTDLCNLIF